MQYKSNKNYSRGKIAQVMAVYQMAKAAGDDITLREATEEIYKFAEKYVYKTLWNRYATLMRSSYKNDIVQEVWAKIFKEIGRYNPDIASITTFLSFWITHAVSDYTSRRFTNTSVYYASAIKKVAGAQAYCRQKSIKDTPEIISTLTGLPPITVDACLDIMSKKSTVSYEVLVDAGFERQSSFKSPEETAMEHESERKISGIMSDVLTNEEMEIAKILINPSDDSKQHSSYREIMQLIPNSNVPKIKRAVSRITKKLLENEEFKSYFPYITQQEELIDNAESPIIGIDKASDEADLEAFCPDGIKKAKGFPLHSAY